MGEATNARDKDTIIHGTSGIKILLDLNSWICYYLLNKKSEQKGGGKMKKVSVTPMGTVVYKFNDQEVLDYLTDCSGKSSLVGKVKKMENFIAITRSEIIFKDRIIKVKGIR